MKKSFRKKKEKNKIKNNNFKCFSTDSGWDNPFRPDGDLSREADEIVELIKGGKPITPTPGQNPPLLPGCNDKNNDEIDTNKNTTINSTTGHINNGNGTQNTNINKQPVNEKVTNHLKQQKKTLKITKITFQEWKQIKYFN